MMIIDLTHPLTAQTPVYPSDPPFLSTPHATHQRDGYAVHHLSLGTHTGTHLDAPFHFHASGADVGRLPIESVFGGFHIVDLEELGLGEREKIPWEAIEPRLPADLTENTIVLIHTSWGSRLTDYCTSHPYLCPTIAQNLLSRGISVVGVDTPSPDETPRADGSTRGGDGFAFHERFLGCGGVIVENLANLGELIKAVREEEGKWIVSLVPLKLDGLDGSPIRAFAFRVPG
jgi:kynurenine formamidase